MGGGSGLARPGALSLAHRGVLFLDEAPEFANAALQALRQPLESGRVLLARARGNTEYPARVQLVLAANPCPCASPAERPVVRVHGVGAPALPRQAVGPAARPDRHPDPDPATQRRRADDGHDTGRGLRDGRGPRGPGPRGGGSALGGGRLAGQRGGAGPTTTAATVAPA
nr:hypothetical protein GCM10020092_018050 [Actinoplanes digitatis]